MTSINGGVCSKPQAAKRELKEETGLAASRVLGESPPVAMDPGMSSAMLRDHPSTYMTSAKLSDF